MEDYIEMLYRLTAGTQLARLGDVAVALNVQPPSASKMIQRLLEADYVVYEKYGFIRLTDTGKRLGKQLMERHRILETFLRLLGLRVNILKDTERIEHMVSEEFLERISRFNDYAKENPYWLAHFLSRYPPQCLKSENAETKIENQQDGYSG